MTLLASTTNEREYYSARPVLSVWRTRDEPQDYLHVSQQGKQLISLQEASFRVMVISTLAFKVALMKNWRYHL